MTRPLAFGTRDYQGAMLALLPRGRIWRRELGSILARVLGALAPTYARSTEVANGLLVDVVPTTTNDLLPEWEASLGLPDGCAPAGQSVSQRQAAVGAKWAARGGQSAAYFVSLAARLGYPITITMFAPSRFGQPFGRPFGGEAWAHAWQVHAPTFTIQRFRFGADSFGSPFASFGNTYLQCRLQAAAPAQTAILFSYS